MVISCIIVDNEPVALQLLENYMLKTPFLELVGKYTNAIDVLQHFYEGGDAELIYTDIQMPELTGLELSKELSPHTRIIFTTAFGQYAIERYRVNATGYLLKPFNYLEFLETVEKAMLLAPVPAEKAATQGYMFVKADYKQIKMPYSDILYIEGLKDYVKIYLTTQPQPLVTLLSLKRLEEHLPAERLMRMHRSFIVALDKVQVVECSQTVFGNQRITIADASKEAFLQRVRINSEN